MFDSQVDALAAKNAVEELLIKQQNTEHGPLYERDVRISWSKSSKFPAENEILKNGTHEHITRRYIHKEKIAHRNDLLIEFRSPVKNEEKAKELLRDYFPKEEFPRAKKEMTMKWVDGSAWIMQTNAFQVADRIFHNRPKESGRELVNRLANVHIRSGSISPREWRRIVNEEAEYRRRNNKSNRT